MSESCVWLMRGLKLNQLGSALLTKKISYLWCSDFFIRFYHSVIGNMFSAMPAVTTAASCNPPLPGESWNELLQHESSASLLEKPPCELFRVTLAGTSASALLSVWLIEEPDGPALIFGCWPHGKMKRNPWSLRCPLCGAEASSSLAWFDHHDDTQGAV